MTEHSGAFQNFIKTFVDWLSYKVYAVYEDISHPWFWLDPDIIFLPKYSSASQLFDVQRYLSLFMSLPQF